MIVGFPSPRMFSRMLSEWMFKIIPQINNATPDNPQSYDGGYFGSASYPLVFVRPKYPEYLPQERRAEFNDNIALAGRETWELFVAEVGKHNRGEASAFTTMNSNPRVRKVEAALAPEE